VSWPATLLALAGLLLAGIGFYNDVAWHIGLGRDEVTVGGRLRYFGDGWQASKVLAGRRFGVDVVGEVLLGDRERREPRSWAQVRGRGDEGVDVLGADLGALWDADGEGGLSVWQGADVVVGITVSWIPLAADYTRFARRPRLLMLDEPSLGLAPRVVESMMSILSDLHRGGMSVLIVEQNVHAVLALAERAYILEGGRIVGEGEGRKLLEDDHVRAAYLGPLARVGES
jgi:hypothetical protein